MLNGVTFDDLEWRWSDLEGLNGHNPTIDYRLLDYWTIHTLEALFVPSMNYSYSAGRFIPCRGLFVPSWTIRTMDHSYRHWTFPTIDDSYFELFVPSLTGRFCKSTESTMRSIPSTAWSIPSTARSTKSTKVEHVHCSAWSTSTKSTARPSTRLATKCRSRFCH